MFKRVGIFDFTGYGRNARGFGCTIQWIHEPHSNLCPKWSTKTKISLWSWFLEIRSGPERRGLEGIYKRQWRRNDVLFSIAKMSLKRIGFMMSFSYRWWMELLLITHLFEMSKHSPPVAGSYQASRVR